MSTINTIKLHILIVLKYKIEYFLLKPFLKDNDKVTLEKVSIL